MVGLVKQRRGTLTTPARRAGRRVLAIGADHLRCIVACLARGLMHIAASSLPWCSGGCSLGRGMQAGGVWADLPTATGPIAAGSLPEAAWAV